MSGTEAPVGKNGTWWFLASEIPIFGGLIASYIVMRLGSAAIQTRASSSIARSA